MEKENRKQSEIQMDELTITKQKLMMFIKWAGKDMGKLKEILATYFGEWPDG